MKLIVDNNLIAVLNALHISTSRSGMDHTPPHPIMRWKVGDILNFQKNTAIEEFCTIAAGNSLISAGAFSTTASVLPSNTTLGRYVAIGPGCRCLGFRHPIEAISINSAIYNFHRENIYPYFEQYERVNGKLEKSPVPTPQPNSKPIVIGPDVWFASNVTFSGGITVGTGAIVASNSVITKDIPPYSFVAGVPAKVKKMRFSENVVERLLKSQWWKYELGDFFKFRLNLANPIEFLDELEKRREDLSIFNPRVFYPLEYVTRRSIGMDLPMDALVTDHGTILGVNLNDSKIIQIGQIKNLNALPISLHNQNGKTFLFINEINKYISAISTDLHFTLSSVPSPCESIQNANGTISLKVEDKFISAEKDGSCSLKNWNKDWEQFFESRNFKNSFFDKKG